nr:BCCT family transporter [Roseospira visakhapatnamensis]
MLVALSMTTVIAVWGVVDTDGLSALASSATSTLFTSRGWFIMLTTSVMLLLIVALALSPYGRIKLGQDWDKPEFSTVSWLTMMFAAGMGVGLLYYGAAEPLTHFALLSDYVDPAEAATIAHFVTTFHWGLHAWAIYGMVALVIAYFGFRKGTPKLMSAPLIAVFGRTRATVSVGWVTDLAAIVAIAIGVAGSLAMGVFQLEAGVVALFGLTDPAPWLPLALYAGMCATFLPPLLVDLGRGMAVLSNTAMVLAVGLMVFVLLAGPTSYVMSSIVGSIGEYIAGVVPHGFRTFTFFDARIEGWFRDWTLSYMAWWLAWGPFVGVFVARISRGRTIREFVFGVLLAPTLFSIVWFGVFSSVGFFGALRTELPVLEVVAEDFNRSTFYLLEQLPLSALTTLAVVLAAFLFIVTSVVSAAFVLGMFSSGGDANPAGRVKVIWGVILAALGLVMILSDSIGAVRSIIALGAMPFLFIVHLLMVSLVRFLAREEVPR